MKSRPPFLSAEQDAIEARAAAWLAQRDDALTAEERAEFDRWQEADPRHAEAVGRLAKTWTALHQLREFRPKARIHPDPDVLLGAKRSANIISFPRIAAAAVAAAIAIVAVLYSRPHAAGAQAIIQPVYATTAGGYQRVTLEDGSVLELNANSRVRVQFTTAVRHVALERGEAHFTVAKNPARPFIVQAQSVSVRAVGTAFNVRLEERGVEVLVTEGRVQVRDQAQAAAALPELAAGQRLMVSKAEVVAVEPPAAEALAPEAMQESLAWQGPRLRFVDTPLASVVAQFNRRNQLQLQLGDASLVNLPVDGSFRAEHVEAFVRLLESNGTIHADRVGEGRIILRRAR